MRIICRVTKFLSNFRYYIFKFNIKFNVPSPHFFPQFNGHQCYGYGCCFCCAIIWNALICNQLKCKNKMSIIAGATSHLFEFISWIRKKKTAIATPLSALIKLPCHG